MTKLPLSTNLGILGAIRLAAIVVSGLIAAQTGRAALIHHWDFNTDGTDSISASNVTLVGSATISGGALNIPGGAVFADYGSVNLAATINNNPTLTVECWYTQNVLVNWSKVWMFGFDNPGGQTALSYIDFTPYTGLGGNPPKIDFDTGDANELNAPGTQALNAGQQYHAVTVYDASRNLMSMWINGVLIATNNMGGENITLLGYNTARFGSGYFYADQELNGSINDIRIYNHATTPLQILVNFAAGPDTVPSSYTPTAVHLSVASTNLLGGDTEQGSVTGDFGSISNVDVTVAVTNWSSSNPGVVAVNQSGLLTAVGAGNATITATVGGVSGSVVVFVAAVQPAIARDLQPMTVFVGSSVALSVGATGGNLTYYWHKNGTLIPGQTANASLNFPAIALSDDANYDVTASNQVGTASSSTVHVTVLQQSLDHRYSMDDATVTDSIAGANGTPINNITFSGGQANFPGTVPSGPGGDYISLPSGLVSAYNSITFETWATIQPNGNWNQLCAFGDQAGTAGNTYLALIPHSGPGDYRMTIKSLGVERATGGAAPVDTTTPVHLVAVYNADTSNEVLYANGKVVSTLSTRIDISNVNNINSWLGRSLFDGDASMKGSMNEFRIWNGPLTQLQIAVNDGLGPNTVNTNPGAFLNVASVSVANNPMVGGTSQQGTALANFANISSVPFNCMVTNWTSANTNVATVSAAGVITAVGQGTSVVSATALGSTGSVTITVLAVQPTISQQPASQTRYLGGSARFTVAAAGGQLAYQWYKATSPIANATNSQYSIIGLVSGDATDYKVVVTNSAGSVTSSPAAHLTVSALPAGYPGAVMGDSPVAYWRLDESSGTAMVDSFNLNNGTYSGAVTEGTPGLIFGGADASATFNSGATVNGTGTVPYNTNVNPSTFTVEFWANPLTTTVGGQYVVSLQDRATGRRGYAVQFDNITTYSWDFTYGTTLAGAFASISSPPPRVMAGTLYYIVASYDGTTARLYVNGTLVSSAATTYQPAVSPVDLTIASRNGNNYTRAVLDDVALYNYALSPAQVATHYALGRSGNLAATIVANPTPANTKGVVGMAQTFTADASGQSPLSLQWLKNGAPIAGATTTTTLRLPSLQLSDAGSYSLRASNSVSGAVTSSAATLTVANQPFLLHRWSFNDGTDSVSGSNATLFGSATYSGGQLQLNGAGHLVGYANVNIASTFANNSSLTFEGWYTDNAGLNWAKVWMFGLSTDNYIDYTPHRGDANHQASMSFKPLGTEVNTANLPLEPPVLTVGTTYHVVAAYDSAGNKMNLYLNGALVATNNMLGSDLTLIQAAQGLIGASLFGDPDVVGSIDEIRVWKGALSASQVAATDFAGPSATPDFNVSLGASVSGGTLTVTWSAGTLLQSSNVLGPYVPVSGASPPSYSVPVSGAPNMFYRVQVQ